MSSIFLHMHLGLGDHIICHGIVREYCKKYDRVGIFCHPHNYQSVSFMYRDLKNLEIMQGSEKDAREFARQGGRGNKHAFDEMKIVGFENLDGNSGELFEKQFYRLAGVDFSKKWDSFFVERDREREEVLWEKVAPRGEYVFLHEDSPRNYRIERRMIDSRYPIVTANPKTASNAFDYCTVIERAKEIHVIDSSFMFLVDCLSYRNPDQKLYVHRYARENTAWKLPVLKKDWEILTLASTENGRFSTFLDSVEGLFLHYPPFKRVTRKIYRTLGWRTRAQKRGSI